MAYTVNILPVAYAGIRGIARFISQQVSPASAARWHNAIHAKIRTLTNNPKRFPLAYEAADLGIELREMLYGRQRHVYRILFTIDGQTVNVHQVRHAAQNRLSSGDI